MNKNKKKEDIGTISYVGANANLKGTLSFKAILQINGTFEGTIISQGTLIISDGATVQGHTEVSNIICNGLLRGEVHAKEMLEVREHGKLYADVYTANLRIADGVTFEGTCHMIDGHAHNVE